MIKVTIDCFGNRNDLAPERFCTPAGEKHAHLIDAQEGVTYIGFGPAAVVGPIHKIVTEGTVTTIWWAYGLWADRETLTYASTKNDVLTIQVAE